jgi:hypothetical protein
MLGFVTLRLRVFLLKSPRAGEKWLFQPEYRKAVEKARISTRCSA